MPRFIRILVRWAILWVALTIAATAWVMRRGDLGLGNAVPTGVIFGTVLTVAVLLTLRKLRRRPRNVEPPQ